MKNGVHLQKRKYLNDRWFWFFNEEKSPLYENEELAKKGYIDRLLRSPYAELISGKSYEHQVKLVFG